MLFIGAGMLLLLLMMALLPSIFAHQSPYTIDVSRALKPPSAANLFGTDDTGRDVYARVVHGTGVTLAICAGSLLLAALVGGAAGALSGLSPRGASSSTADSNTPASHLSFKVRYKK